MTAIRASILTIGTEVSTGQIVNSNASWIADQLVNLRIDPVWHLTVPDAEAEMLDAISIAVARCDIVIITGGLGPTADDITRDIIAKWSGDQLVFDQASWSKIEERFRSFGITAPESNRRQCYFPASARIIDNPSGTANAFQLKRGKLQLWCLPGPPEEIKSIWKTSLKSELMELAKGTSGQKLLRWHCIGLSESALGEIVEQAIAHSSLISGYRPHFPYEEIKIWCPTAELESNRPYFEALDRVLAPWTVAKDDEDCVTTFLDQLRTYREVWIDDAASCGALANRLAQAWTKAQMLETRLAMREQFPGSEPHEAWQQPPPGVLHLTIGPLNAAGEWQICWHSHTQRREQMLQLSYRRDARRFDRERLFVCEKSLVAWSRAAQHGGELLA